MENSILTALQAALSAEIKESIRLAVDAAVPTQHSGFRTFLIDDGFGGHIEVLQYPPQPTPPAGYDAQLVPYDKL